MRTYIFLPLCVCAQLAIAQTHELDSVYQLLETHTQQDTVRVNVLLEASYREGTSEPEKSKEHAEQALEIAQKIGFSKGKGYAYRHIANYYRNTGNYSKATEYAYQMLRVFEAMPLDRGIGLAYQLLGVIQEENENPEKAKTLYLQAIEYLKRSHSQRQVGYCYNNLGALLLNQQKLDEALDYYLKSLAIRKEMKDESALSQTYSNLGHLYVKQKKYREAVAHFEKAIPYELKSNNRYRLASIYAGMGEMYLAMGYYTNAERYLLRAVDLAKYISQKKMLVGIYSKLIELEHARKQPEAEIQYHELRARYRDSIYTVETAEQVAKIEARFETEKKEHTIRILERDRKIQQLWNNILTGAIVLLGACFVAVYLLQRFRERKNRQILNLEIDNLTSQHKELSEKYKTVVTTDREASGHSLDQRLLIKAIDVVEDHLSDPLFGVEEMAREMAMSRTNLHRKIKTITGFPPSELIRSIRMKRAAALLLNQENTVTEVGFSVGFNDHSYFSKCFKKHFGVSPSEYFDSGSRQVT